MVVMNATREELISDLPKAFKDQNDLQAMSDKKLIDVWRRQGTHAGTWDWDYIKIVEED